MRPTQGTNPGLEQELTHQNGMVALSFSDRTDCHERETRGDVLLARSATVLQRLPSYEADTAADWLRLLAQRASTTPGEGDALAQEGAAEVACQVMRKHARHGRLQAAGLMLMQQVATSNVGAAAVLQARATSVTVALLRRFFDAQLEPPPPAEPLLSLRCLSLLLAMRMHSGNAAVEVMLENGVVPVAPRCCRASSADASLALQLLLSMADAHGATHLMLVDCAAPAVLHAVTVWAKEDAMQETAFLLLWALAETPRGRTELVSDFAINPAHDVLRRELQLQHAPSGHTGLRSTTILFTITLLLPFR